MCIDLVLVPVIDCSKLSAALLVVVVGGSVSNPKLNAGGHITMS